METDDIIRVSRKNETYIKILCDAGILYELKEYLTFEVPGAKFTPKYKAKMWDGKISLIDVRTGLMYAGLLGKLTKFCEDRSYILNIDDEVMPMVNVTPSDIFNFVKSLNIHSDGQPLEPRDYQLAAIYFAIKNRRRTLLSPTASGKSLIIYTIIRWILNETNGTILLIVPNIGLVKQMYSDFVDYSTHNDFDVAAYTQTISEGSSKVINSNIVISTWQSIYKQDQKWLNQFDAIICDEVHLAQANSIRGIMEKATDVYYRIGLTGTLSDAKTHEWVIEGLFGKVMRVATTSDLIEKGHIAGINIKCIIINYQDKEERKLIKDADYAGEIGYICNHEKRNNLIKKLVINQQGNTLVLYNYVDKHGQLLYDLISDELAVTDPTRKIFFIHGNVSGADRDSMRAIVEKEDNAIIVASYGTLSTGTNIKRLHNIIIASPTKSVIRLLQSIGRGLRKASGKDKLNWIDIVDDFSGGYKTKNFVFEHFIKRLQIYVDEKFEYKILKIKL